MILEGRFFNYKASQAMSKRSKNMFKFSPILFTIVISVLLVSAATLWPILQQDKQNAIQQLKNESIEQANLLKTLFKPTIESKSQWATNKAKNEAIQKLQNIWNEDIVNLSDFRYFLISKNSTTNEAEVLLDIGQTNIPLSQSLFKPIFNRSFSENSVLNISEDYFLSIAPIYDDKFGLLILHKQPNLQEIIQKVAPFTGASIFVAIILSWLILKLWRRQTLKHISNDQSRYKQIVESSMDWVWETDRHGKLVYCSEHCFNLLGFTPAEMIEKSFFQFLASSEAQKIEQQVMHLMQKKEPIYNLEASFETKTGAIKNILIQGQPFGNDKGKITGYRGINRDITKQKEKHNTIVNMAFFDPLTGLSNRPNLIEQLNKHLDEVIQRKDLTLSALLFIDLDGFKDVNDSQGHEVGDELLKTIAKRMTSLSGEPTHVFRLGGDEFVVLIRCQNKMLMPDFKILLNEYLSRLLLAINEPLIIDSHSIIVSASVGVALIPQDGRTSSEILSHADNAMYLAKKEGKNCFRYFDASMQELEDKRKQMVRDIKKAIENKEFKLYYQLQIDAGNQKIYGMEALIRWPHPTKNIMISPADFIELAYESNNIQAIDEWVIEESAKDIARMQQSTNRSIPVSINLSAKTLENPNLVNLINNAIEKNFISPSDLRIEVTETTLLKNLNKAVETLNTLKSRGIKASIDDFGTGYSSLSYLQKLPVDTLKIDKSFIDKITTSNSDLEICRSIIQLAKSLDKNLIAEGVQSEIQQKILVDEGCHIIQGFLYAQPEPMSDIIQLLMKPDIKEDSSSLDQNQPMEKLKLFNQT